LPAILLLKSKLTRLLYIFSFSNIGNPKAVDREIAVAGLHKKKRSQKDWGYEWGDGE